MHRSTFRTIKYMNGVSFSKGQVYEWGRLRNTGSHTRTTIICRLHPHPRGLDIRLGFLSRVAHIMDMSESV